MATRQKRSTRTTPNRGKELLQSPSFLTSWLRDVTSVLARPPLAMTLFLLGIVFIIIASKQARLVIDVLEYYHVNVRQNSVTSHFLAIAVFLLVWVDIVLLMVLKSLLRRLFYFLGNGYEVLAEVLDEVASRERRKFKSLRNKKR